MPEDCRLDTVRWRTIFDGFTFIDFSFRMVRTQLSTLTAQRNRTYVQYFAIDVSIVRGQKLEGTFSPAADTVSKKGIHHGDTEGTEKKVGRRAVWRLIFCDGILVLDLATTFRSKN